MLLLLKSFQDLYNFLFSHQTFISWLKSKGSLVTGIITESVWALYGLVVLTSLRILSALSNLIWILLLKIVVENDLGLILAIHTISTPISLDWNTVSFFEVNYAPRYYNLRLRDNLILECLVNTPLVMLDMLVLLPLVYPDNLVLRPLTLLALGLEILLLLHKFLSHSRQVGVVFHIAIILQINVLLLLNFVRTLRLYSWFTLFRIFSFFRRIFWNFVWEHMGCYSRLFIHIHFFYPRLLKLFLKLIKFIKEIWLSLVAIFQISWRIRKSTRLASRCCGISSTFLIFFLFETTSIVLGLKHHQTSFFLLIHRWLSFLNSYWLFFFHFLRFQNLLSVTWWVLILAYWSTFLVIALVNIAFCFYRWSFCWSRDALCRKNRIRRVDNLLLFSHWFGPRRSFWLRIGSCDVYYLNWPIDIEAIALNLISTRNGLAFLAEILIQILERLRIKRVIALNMPMLSYMNVGCHRRHRTFFHMLFLIRNNLNLHFALLEVFVLELLKLAKSRAVDRIMFLVRRFPQFFHKTLFCCYILFDRWLEWRAIYCT